MTTDNQNLTVYVDECPEYETIAVPTKPVTLAELEKNYILQTLAHNSGNRSKTARDLGISIRTVRNKLAKYRGEGVQV